VVALLALAFALVACDSGATEPTPPPSSGPPVDSVEAFQSFSGLTVPGTAEDVTVQVVGSSAGQPEYLVTFQLTTAELDDFCISGGMQRPLRVTTIPASVRERFDYTGDASTGAAVAEASLPSDVSIQRLVLAVDTKTPTSQVQVFASKMPA
jgi:hypothetical protein